MLAAVPTICTHSRPHTTDTVSSTFSNILLIVLATVATTSSHTYLTQETSKICSNFPSQLGIEITTSCPFQNYFNGLIIV